jgi:hypothetical protein
MDNTPYIPQTGMERRLIEEILIARVIAPLREKAMHVLGDNYQATIFRFRGDELPSEMRSRWDAFGRYLLYIDISKKEESPWPNVTDGDVLPIWFWITLDGWFEGSLQIWWRMEKNAWSDDAQDNYWPYPPVLRPEGYQS